MTHLGTQISALADGRLTGLARERALCHVAACPTCAQELTATRAARQVLAAAADVPPAPNLAPRLLALGAIGSCGGVLEPGTVVGGAGTAKGTRPPLGGGPVLDSVFDIPTMEGSATGWRRPSVRMVAVATVGAVVVGLFMLGDARDVTPQSHPADDLALLAAASAPSGVVSTAGSTGGAGSDAADVADGAEPADVDPAVLDAVWPGGELPDGYTVVATRGDAPLAEIDLEGPSGTVVVLRQPGHLRTDVVAGLPTAMLGEHEVHVLSVQPWHAVWQSGDAVVGVVSAHRTDAVDELVTAYPEVDGDDGVSARVSRGLEAVVGAWSP